MRITGQKDKNRPASTPNFWKPQQQHPAAMRDPAGRFTSIFNNFLIFFRHLTQTITPPIKVHQKDIKQSKFKYPEFI